MLREQGSGTRSTFEGELRRRGLDPNTLEVALTLPSNEAVRSAVEAGAGATVISSSVAAAGITAGTLVEIPFECAPRAFTVLSSKERYRSRAATALLELARSEKH